MGNGVIAVHLWVRILECMRKGGENVGKAERKRWKKQKVRDGESGVVPCSRSNLGHDVAACVFCGREKQTGGSKC